MKKRALATLLAICLALTLFPIQAAAASVSAVPSGYTGIYTAEDLDAVRNNLSGNYILMNDIDLSTWGNWQPIGGSWQQESSNFSGTFDGNGYSIFNMTITEESAYSGSYAGLFTVIRGATVKNIKEITGSITSQGKAALCAGAVCAEAYDSEIINCASSIDVSYQFGEPTGDVIWTSLNVYCTVGGIAGTISGTTIENCCNFGNVSGISHPATMNLGGITAKYSNNSEVMNCYNAGSLAANTDFATAEVGGIVGLYFTAGNSLQIRNCYNLGAISCSAGVETNNRMGGILGSSPQYSYTNNIINCYYLDTGMPAVGHIAKDDDGNSHTTVTATALSRSAMRSQASFAGFDFSNTWMMGGPDYPYPVLRALGQPGESEAEEVPAETLTVSLSTGTTVSEGTPVTVSWNAPSQAFRYYISAVNLTTNLYYVRDHILYDTSYDLSTRAVPLPSGEYEITVRAVDGNGNTVAESDAVTLLVTSDPSVSFAQRAVTLNTGDTARLSFTYRNSDRAVQVTSSNPSVVIVEAITTSNGTGYAAIRGAGAGTATLTIRVSRDSLERTSSCTVVVESTGLETAQRFVDMALSHVGETASTLGLGSSWCDKFIGWCSRQLGLANVLDYSGSTGVTRASDVVSKGGSAVYFSDVTAFDHEEYRNREFYNYAEEIDRADYTPQVGDIVLFRPDSLSNVYVDSNDDGNSELSLISHVGIVCDVDDTYAYVVHGNWHGRVCAPEGYGNQNCVRNYSSCGKFPLDGRENQGVVIIGYIRPNWSAASGVRNGSKTYSIACPVDVQISYDGEVLDSATGQFDASFGTMTVDGTGTISAQINGYYDTEITITDTGSGTMNFTATYLDEDGTTGTRTFQNVPITEDTVIRGIESNSATGAVALEIYRDSSETLQEIWYASSNAPTVSSANQELTDWYLHEGTGEDTFSETTEEPVPSDLPFTDVSTSDWFYDAVAYVYENGLMGGTSANQFSPNVTTTRSMIVTILHRLEGEPAASTSTFTDVAAGQWYTDAVAWASANRIVEGYGNGRFGPNDTITREQMATILYRYAQSKGYDVGGTGDLGGYSDASQVSDWARTAMGWANAQGLITGNTATTLNPTGSATRAEAATILMRFVENAAG